MLLLIAQVILVAIAIILHEVSHGWVAYKLGDPTAKQAGRLSLNPLKHIDPFGTILLPLMLAFTTGFGFGYAKPVPYNPRYFKNVKMGEFLVGLSGPASNLLQALVAAGLFRLIHYVMSTQGTLGLPPVVVLSVLNVLSLYIWINLVLMFFNLIPIPPLDGSSIIAPFLSDKALAKYYKVQQVGPIVFILGIILISYLFHVDILSIYFNYTARPLLEVLLP